MVSVMRYVIFIYESSRALQNIEKYVFYKGFNECLENNQLHVFDVILIGMY